MSNGRYYAFHYYDSQTGKFLGEITNENRMAILREREEYMLMGFHIPNDPNRDDGLLELSTGPLFETPMDYNEALDD
jgi:hypothetical protein